MKKNIKGRIAAATMAFAMGISLVNVPVNVLNVQAAGVESEDAIASGETAEGLSWVIDADGVLTISGNGAMPNVASPADIPWTGYMSNIVKVVIEDGVTSISAFAFMNAQQLREVVIGNDVSTIGMIAFAGCAGLSEIKLGNGITTISGGVFSGCTSLSEIVFPSSIASIADGAFQGCSNLRTVEFAANSSIETITSNAFVGSAINNTVKVHISDEAAKTVLSNAGLSVVDAPHVFDENTHLCECGAAADATNVVLYSCLNDGSVLSVAKLTSDKTQYFVGEKAACEAEDVIGYDFVGWYIVDESDVSEATINYTNGVKASSDINGTVTIPAVEGDVVIVAVYKPSEGVAIKIVSNKSIIVASSVEEGAVQYNGTVNLKYVPGTEITVQVVDDYDFAYWANEAGERVSKSPTYTFTVVGATTLTPVYGATATSVKFVSGYNQVIQMSEGTAINSMTIPSGPIKTNYNFIGWSLDGETLIEDYSFDNFKKALNDAVRATEEDITVQALYEQIDKAVTITYSDGVGEKTIECKVGDPVTLTAKPVDGLYFRCWKFGTDVVSYNPSYSFYACGTENYEFTADYTLDPEDIIPVGVARIEMIEYPELEKVSFLSLSSVPEGCTIVDTGVIISKERPSTLEGGELTLGNCDGKYGEGTDKANYRYTLTVGGMKGKVLYARAYLTYQDADGNEETVYSTSYIENFLYE